MSAKHAIQTLARRGKGELEKVRTDVPSLYVGESSRSIYERSKEHWGDWRSRSSRSHIKKHQEQAHEGNEEPNFQMRVIGSSKTALSRQIKEAVRIRRRGGEGSILNSKSEYSRCKIPRLIIEEEDEEELDKLEDEELARKREQLEHELSTWSNMKFYARERECREKRRRLEKIERKITARKREQDHEGKIEIQKKRRKLKHAIIEKSWGSVEGEQEQGSLAGKNKSESDSGPGASYTLGEEDRVDCLQQMGGWFMFDLFVPRRSEGAAWLS